MSLVLINLPAPCLIIKKCLESRKAVCLELPGNPGQWSFMESRGPGFTAKALKGRPLTVLSL
jgi:hypothetical protein